MERVVGYRILLLISFICVVLSTIYAPLLISEEQPESLPLEEISVENDSLDTPTSAPETAPFVENDSDSSLNPTSFIAILFLVLFSVGLIGSLTTGVLISEGVRTGILLAAFGPLIGISLRGENATLTRGRIQGYVEAHPGIHYSALRDALGLANGVISHHLYILEKEGSIFSWADGIRRRYAVSGIDKTTAKILENPVTGMQHAILVILSQSGDLGLTSIELRHRIEVSRQLMSYHLNRLSERRLIHPSGRGRKSKWYLTQEGTILLDAQKLAKI